MLEQKIARGERVLRFVLTGGAIAVVACIGAWIATARVGVAHAQSMDGVPKVIRVSKLILDDGSGLPRAFLGVEENGPGLGLYDWYGRGRIMLMMDKGGPALYLSDKKGKTRAAVAVTEAGPKICLYGDDGKPIWSKP